MGTGRQILDGICKFVAKNPNASFATDGAFFGTPENFSKAIKDCNPVDMDRAWLQGVAASVNQSIDGVKGDILTQISNEASAADNVPFMPYFKILYKLAQLGMTITKRTSLERKVESSTKAMNDAQVEVDKQSAIVQNLAFYERVEREFSRANEQEIETLRVKRDELDRKIKEFQDLYAD